MCPSGLRDFNSLRIKETDAGQDTIGDLEEPLSDPYCQEEIDSDPHFREEIAIINKGLEEMEEQMIKMSDQCGVHCSTTSRLPCVAHKASLNHIIKSYLSLLYSLKVHLVVEKCVSVRMQVFGPLLKRVRGMVVKYRMSSKAKAFLVTLFEKMLPGFIVSRW